MRATYHDEQANSPFEVLQRKGQQINVIMSKFFRQFAVPIDAANFSPPLAPCRGIAPGQIIDGSYLLSAIRPAPRAHETEYAWSYWSYRFPCTTLKRGCKRTWLGTFSTTSRGAVILPIPASSTVSFKSSSPLGSVLSCISSD